MPVATIVRRLPKAGDSYSYRCGRGELIIHGTTADLEPRIYGSRWTGVAWTPFTLQASVFHVWVEELTWGPRAD